MTGDTCDFAPADTCYWCGEPAEHMCADCECDLCEACLIKGRCMGCQPLSEDQWDEIRKIRASSREEEATWAGLGPDPVTGREVAA